MLDNQSALAKGCPSGQTERVPNGYLDLWKGMNKKAPEMVSRWLNINTMFSFFLQFT